MSTALISVYQYKIYHNVRKYKDCLGIEWMTKPSLYFRTVSGSVGNVWFFIRYLNNPHISGHKQLSIVVSYVLVCTDTLCSWSNVPWRTTYPILVGSYFTFLSSKRICSLLCASSCPTVYLYAGMASHGQYPHLHSLGILPVSVVCHHRAHLSRRLDPCCDRRRCSYIFCPKQFWLTSSILLNRGTTLGMPYPLRHASSNKACFY